MLFDKKCADAQLSLIRVIRSLKKFVVPLSFGMEEDFDIALIDTGVSASGAAAERVSMLGGEPWDDNGHGDAMSAYMTEVFPEARILSVKALDESGSGNIATVEAVPGM